jgi:hypothetical protein
MGYDWEIRVSVVFKPETKNEEIDNALSRLGLDVRGVYRELQRSVNHFPPLGEKCHNCRGCYMNNWDDRYQQSDMKKDEHDICDKLKLLTSRFPAYVFRFYYFTFDYESLELFEFRGPEVKKIEIPKLSFASDEYFSLVSFEGINIGNDRTSFDITEMFRPGVRPVQ